MQRGFFDLSTPLDLFKKLQLDYEELRSNPEDTRAAFNFFVTAHHMADWINNLQLRTQHTILRICSHLANDGKHFELDPKRHKSIASAERDKYAEDRYVESGYFAEPLVVRLTQQERSELNTDSIDVMTLAGKVMEFWESRPEIKVP